MRVLLAGASGAIGRYLVPQLIAAKHQVIGITRTAGSLDGTGAREIVADVLDRPALLAALAGVKADAVVHQLTSLSKPPTSYKSMRDTNRLRAEGTSTLIAAARLVGASKFVAASFFGGYGFNDLGAVPLTEAAPFGELDDRNDSVLRPLLTLEQQVRAFGGVSLRYGLFYDSTTAAVSPVSRTWNGVVPNVHLKDAARAVVLVLAKYKPGSVYNIADDAPMTYRDREIARAEAADLKPPMQLPDSVLRVAAPFGSMLLTRTSMRLDSSLARTELGWTPEFASLLECLKVAAPIPREVKLPRSAPSRTSGTATPAVAEALEAPTAEENPEPQPVPQPVEGPTPEETPAPEPVAEALEAPASEEPESVPEPVEGPTDEETTPDEEPSPVSKPTAVPEPVPVPERTVVPEPVEGPAPNETPKKPKDPFANIDAAIARIGASSRDD